jgi:hypothetical protein
MMPPAELDEDLDSDHDDEVLLRFHTMDNIISMSLLPGYTSHDLGGGQLFAVSAEEPGSLAKVEHDPCWCRVMKEELCAIKENYTWTLTELPPGRRSIGLKWVLKAKEEYGAVVQHKARLVVKGCT